VFLSGAAERSGQAWTIWRRLGESFSTKASAWLESGKHADHRTIVAELQRSADYALVRLHLENPGVLKQFDIICAEARKRAKYEASRT
jgi:hypothetical protein